MRFEGQNRSCRTCLKLKISSRLLYTTDSAAGCSLLVLIMLHISFLVVQPLGKRRFKRRGGILKSTFYVLLFIAILGGIVAGAMWRPSEKPVEKLLTKEVMRGPFENVVVEQGEIESSSNVEVRCEVKSRGMSGMTILEVVPEGTLVEEGKLLVRLDSTALEQDKIQQQIACNTSEAAVIQAQNTYEAAKIARTEYLEGTFKQDEQAILSEIFVAEQNLRTSQLAFSSAERLSLRGIVTSLQLEGEQFAVEKSRNELSGAQTKLLVLRKYTQEKMLKQLDSDIATAEAKWNAEKKTLELEETKLKDIEDQIRKCTLIAPRAGQVVYANKYSQGRGGSSAEFVVEPGAVVREQQPIIRLPDPAQMQVRTLINESRVNSVRLGMTTSIRVDALHDQVLTGQVLKVNQYAEPGGWSSGNIKKYAAIVKIIDPPATLRTSMNAEVRIFVERRPDAVQIPVQAVAPYKKHFFCLVENNGKLETRPIENGPSNEKFLVVLKGLAEGEHVVLNPRARPELHLPNLPDEEPVAKEIKPVAAAAVPGEAGGEKKAGPPRDMNPAAMVARTLGEYDTDKDGKLQASEIAAMPEDRRARQLEADANKDGVVDRAELTAAATARMRARAEGGGGAPQGANP